MSARQHPRSMGRLIAGLFLLLFAFYALTGPGYSISGDGSFLLLSARNLLRTGSSSVPAIPDTELSRRRGVDGREYAKFAPGLVFAHLPMLLAVQHLEPPEIEERVVDRVHLGCVPSDGVAHRLREQRPFLVQH